MPGVVFADKPAHGARVRIERNLVMNRKHIANPLWISIAALAFGLSAAPAQANVDAAAANALAKKSDCLKCHAIDKDKKASSFQKIAAKYKGKADGQASIIKAITTGPKVKIDGNEEEHKILDSKDAAAQKNLADWILAQ